MGKASLWNGGMDETTNKPWLNPESQVIVSDLITPSLLLKLAGYVFPVAPAPAHHVFTF
jgi:hypothetical protein